MNAADVNAGMNRVDCQYCPGSPGGGGNSAARAPDGALGFFCDQCALGGGTRFVVKEIEEPRGIRAEESCRKPRKARRLAEPESEVVAVYLVMAVKRPGEPDGDSAGLGRPGTRGAKMETVERMMVPVDLGGRRGAAVRRIAEEAVRAGRSRRRPAGSM